jgi:hypothetical protein
MDVWEYFQTREREIGECSLYESEDGPQYAAEAKADGQRGKIFGRLYFGGYPETVYLLVHEEVVVRGSGIHRPRYAYFLVIDEQEIGGYERHASHSPPVHRHCSGMTDHESAPSRAISFKDATTEAWRYVSEFAEPLDSN